MKETLLKKAFKESEVQRMRNLISGKAGDKTQTQSGWEKKSEDHKEGDVWEDNGRTWTIKNGIKQNITKLDSIKKMVYFPIACPKCKKAMKNDEINKKMYLLHQTCFDCVLSYEQELKRTGKWEEYEKDIIAKNQQAYLKDLEQAIESWYQEKDFYVSEQGDVEHWLGGDKTKMYEELKAHIKKIKSEQH